MKHLVPQPNPSIPSEVEGPSDLPAIVGPDARACLDFARHGRVGGALVLGLALAACGGKNELQPPPGQTLPPAPYGAEAKPAPSELLTPSTQARPQRSDELLRRSEERRDDRFDLPPS